MGFFDRLRMEKQPPQLLYTYPAEQLRWKRPAMLVWVPDGSGVLKERFSENRSEIIHSFLLLDDIPIIKSHGNGCPTCHQLLAAGYGIDQVDPSVVRQIEACSNQTELTEDSLENVTPLLQLLEPGLYLLSVVPYIPTDGEGNFFWEFPNQDKSNSAFHLDGDHISPLFMLPTQPKRQYDPARVDFYRQQWQETGNLGGIAYYLDGAISALLDGHHRATAAALEGALVNGLTIFPARIGYWEREGKTIRCLFAGGEQLDASPVTSKHQISINSQSWIDRQLSDEQSQIYQNMIAEDVEESPFPKELKQTVPSYFTFEQLHAIAETGADKGEVTDDEIERVFREGWCEEEDKSELVTVVIALFAIQDPRAVAVAKRIIQDYRWRVLWLQAVELLATIRTPEVEEIFIDWLIEDDKQRPEITQIIVDYFEES